jgi:hypothetical protein
MAFNEVRLQISFAVSSPNGLWPFFFRVEAAIGNDL